MEISKFWERIIGSDIEYLYTPTSFQNSCGRRPGFTWTSAAWALPFIKHTMSSRLTIKRRQDFESNQFTKREELTSNLIRSQKKRAPSLYTWNLLYGATSKSEMLLKKTLNQKSSSLNQTHRTMHLNNYIYWTTIRVCVSTQITRQLATRTETEQCSASGDHRSVMAVFGYCRCKENLLCMMYESKFVCKTFSQIDATLRVESNEPN